MQWLLWSILLLMKLHIFPLSTQYTKIYLLMFNNLSHHFPALSSHTIFSYRSELSCVVEAWDPAWIRLHQCLFCQCENKITKSNRTPSINYTSLNSKISELVIKDQRIMLHSCHDNALLKKHTHYAPLMPSLCSMMLTSRATNRGMPT